MFRLELYTNTMSHNKTHSRAGDVLTPITACLRPLQHIAAVFLLSLQRMLLLVMLTLMMMDDIDRGRRQ